MLGPNTRRWNKDHLFSRHDWPFTVLLCLTKKETNRGAYVFEQLNLIFAILLYNINNVEALNPAQLYHEN